MPQDMSRLEERRGTRGMFVGAAVVAIVIGVGLLAWVFIPGFGASEGPKNAGELSNQTVGISTASQQEPLRVVSPRSTDSYTVGRNQEITATEKPNLAPLSQAQVQAIQNYAAKNLQQAVSNVNFSIAVGGAVPADVKLKDFPPQLAQAVPSYAQDQYFLVDNQFVVVEKQTRRIVAIVPTSNPKEGLR